MKHTVIYPHPDNPEPIGWSEEDSCPIFRSEDVFKPIQYVNELHEGAANQCEACRTSGMGVFRYV